MLPRFKTSLTCISPFFPVPSPQQKTLADYVEGVLEVDLDLGGRRAVAKVKAKRNLSPSLLRRRIEELKENEQIAANK